MTKSVHIINADVSDWKVKIKVQHKDSEGNWVDSDGVYTKDLNLPGQLITQMIHSHQRIIIEENGNTESSWNQKKV